MKELLGMAAAAARCITEHHGWRIGAAMATVVRGDGPEVAGPGPLASGIEHRGGGFIHEQPMRRAEMLAHPVDDGLQVEAGAAGPIAEACTVEIDALPGVDVGLAVEWQMIAKLRHDDMGDERLGGQSAGDDMLRGMGLDHRA